MTSSVFDSDSLFRLLVAQVEDYAIFALDTEGNVRTWNPGAERFKGYKAEEIIGRHFSAFYPPEARERQLPQELLRLAAETGHASDEGWRIRKDGSRFWASVLITALHDADDRHVGFAKITRDLTAQKLAEEQARKLAVEEAARSTAQSFADELEAANEQLQATLVDAEEARDAVAVAERFARGILESIADPFIVLDASWNYRFVNSPAAQLMEPSRAVGPGDLIGRSMWEVYPDILGSDFERNMRRAVEQRIAVSFEAFYPARGEWSLLHCYPLADGGLAVQWRNVTPQKRVEEANKYLARGSEILTRSLDYQETLNDLARLVVPQLADWSSVDVLSTTGVLERVAVAHIDPEKVQLARELHERYPPDPAAPAGVHEVLRSNKPELYPEITDEMLAATAHDEEHLRIARELGLKSAVIVPLSVGDAVLGALTLVSAESNRQFDQQDLQLAMELGHRAGIAVQNARLHRAARSAQRTAEEANQAKSDFLATMSHELRTPLNAIGGYVELLRLGVKGPVSAEQDDYLARIERSERYLLSLIQDVLSFAKIEAGRVDLRPTSVRIRELVDEITTLVAPQLAQADLQLDVEDCTPGVTAYADPERVRQILLNLVTNAIKFTPAGGKIDLLCGSAAHGTVTRVRDTGIGIPADRLEVIFDPFVQLNPRTHGDRGGAGLGLAISRDLARAMGGDLTADSVVGEGSTFTLVLPQVRLQD